MNAIGFVETLHMSVRMSMNVTLNSQGIQILSDRLASNSTVPDEVQFMWREAISEPSKSLQFLLYFRILEYIKGKRSKADAYIKEVEPTVPLEKGQYGEDISVYTYLRDNIHAKNPSFPYNDIERYLPKLSGINMQKKVIQAVALFVKNDSDLLKSSAHEQAISHRVGVYLEGLFGLEKLNIDCEYNKHLDEPKKIDLYDLDPKLCENCKCHSCRFVIKGNLDEIPERGFRPDILVHKRGTDDNNLIAIEVKKDKECPFDEAKLKALTKPFDDGGEYGYQLGVFVWFFDNKAQFKWFVAGREVSKV